MTIDPLLEDTGRPPQLARERAKLIRPHRIRRTPTRFERWAFSSIIAYRLSLTLGYAAASYCGVSALIAGVPAFQVAAPSWWLIVWAPALILSAFVALLGSVSDSRRSWSTELVGAIGLFITLGTYAAVLLVLAYGSGDSARAAAGSGFVWLGVGPALRMVWLMSQLGRKRTAHG